MHTVEVATLNYRLPAISNTILCVQRSAYRLEAKLLGVSRFPPLELTVNDIQQSEAVFLGAKINKQLAGVIGLEPCSEPGQRNIISLAVLPEWHRRGIAKELLTIVLNECTELVITVSTGTKNSQALALYSKFGFVEHSRCIEGRQPIEIVNLRRERPKMAFEWDAKSGAPFNFALAVQD